MHPDPSARMTLEEALAHPYVAELLAAQQQQRRAGNAPAPGSVAAGAGCATDCCGAGGAGPVAVEPDGAEEVLAACNDVHDSDEEEGAERRRPTEREPPPDSTPASPLRAPSDQIATAPLASPASCLSLGLERKLTAKCPDEHDAKHPTVAPTPAVLENDQAPA